MNYNNFSLNNAALKIPLTKLRLSLCLCFQEPPIAPVTFLTRGAHARLRGYEGASSLNVSLSFRTFEPDGLLIWHDFTSSGHVMVGSIFILLISYLCTLPVLVPQIKSFMCLFLYRLG